MEVHAVFDPQWKSGGRSRKMAYQELADALRIPVSDCHIGYFDETLCELALAYLKGKS